MNSSRYDDIVVGAGILGLAHAYGLARRGRRVAVFERDAAATGASIRNFGMLWPIGQPFGPLRKLARASLKTWLVVLKAAGLPHDRCGSFHLAYQDDEAQVLAEYTKLAREAEDPVELLPGSRIGERSRAVVTHGLKAALWSEHETCVDPRVVVAGLSGWLARELGVHFHFGQAVTHVEPPEVVAGGHRHEASRVWICSGADFATLFPKELAASGLSPCKLQMMRTAPLAEGLRIGPMLAAGLSLRHYPSFTACPSLPALRARVARESPWFDEHGIHVLVSQNSDGELTLGDSHEYGPGISPFDKSEIDEFILEYLKTFLDVPSYRITQRWHGVYAKHAETPYLVLKPLRDVSVITGPGGAGMTLSFGLAEQVIGRALGETS